MRIGFLFNHDQIHQVAHSLPIALELARSDPTLDIVVATTNQALCDEVARLASAHGGGEGLTLVRLKQSRGLIGAALSAVDRIVPAAKLAVYRDNLDFFRSLDALVVAEKTSTILKSRYKLPGLRLIHTRHGAGDRAVGFDKTSEEFDLVLVSGAKIRDRLMSQTGLPPEKLAVVGYPKFDLLGIAHPALNLDPNKPTILYNPHVSPHLSSWYRHGRAVLDFFVGNPDYNLIFAPHVMLFERKVVISIDKIRLDWPGTLDPKYLRAPNIHVDLGSASSTDMTYTEAADFYLGDVSSQIYEFLLRPRPCAFLNSHHVDYAGDPNFAHWAAGPVIDDPAQLAETLATAAVTHRRYRNVQRAMFTASIDLNGTPSSRRAALAIRRFLELPDQATLPSATPALRAAKGAEAA